MVEISEGENKYVTQQEKWMLVYHPVKYFALPKRKEGNKGEKEGRKEWNEGGMEAGEERKTEKKERKEFFE